MAGETKRSLWSVRLTVEERDGGVREVGPYIVPAESERFAEWQAAQGLPRCMRYLGGFASPYHADPEVRETQEFLDSLAHVEAESDVRHPDRIGVSRAPEPKSIYSPARKGRISRDPPRKRNLPDPREGDIGLLRAPRLTHPNVSRSVDGHTQRFYREG